MPKPLFTKLIVQTAVGFFFVLIGCVYGIHSKDYIFIMLSLLIGFCRLIHTFSFYRLIHKPMEQLLVEIHRQLFSFANPRKEATENSAVLRLPQNSFC